MTLLEALNVALQDEYKARATYRKVIERFGDVFPFVNIVEAEERHIRALQRLFEKYEIPLPVDDWQRKVEAPASVRDACADGVAAEQENGRLYDRLIEAVGGYPDVQETFVRLQEASQQNHLPAFERCLARDTAGDGCGGADGRGQRRRRRRGRH